MKRIARRIAIALLGGALLLVLVGKFTLAQEKADSKALATSASSAQQWASITVVHVKPEMAAEYEDFVKNEALPAYKKAGVKWRHVWQTAVFGEGFEYVITMPIDSLAQYDGQGMVIKALGQDGARTYNDKLRRFVVNSHSYAAVIRPDLSYMGRLNGPPKMAVISFTQVAPGRAFEFENLIKRDILPVMRKADVLGFIVSQTAFGGDINSYMSVNGAEDFAEISKGSPLVRASGPAALAKMAQNINGLIVHQERTVVRYNPNLSF
jgi:hypothetical protein